MQPQGGKVLGPFWFENGPRLCPFWSGIGYGFRGNYGNVWKYLSFQFQMNKKNRNMRIRNAFEEIFCMRSDLGNDEVISA